MSKRPIRARSCSGVWGLSRPRSTSFPGFLPRTSNAPRLCRCAAPTTPVSGKPRAPKVRRRDCWLARTWPKRTLSRSCLSSNRTNVMTWPDVMTWKNGCLKDWPSENWPRPARSAGSACFTSAGGDSIKRGRLWNASRSSSPIRSRCFSSWRESPVSRRITKALSGTSPTRGTSSPGTPSGAHFFLGRIANQEGHSTEAVRELRLALEGDPNYADAHAELGRVRLNRKEYPLAEKELARALEIDPNNYTANLNLMVLYQRTKDPRAEAQASRFEEVKKRRAQRAKEFLRTIEVRPY